MEEVVLMYCIARKFGEGGCFYGDFVGMQVGIRCWLIQRFVGHLEVVF